MCNFTFIQSKKSIPKRMEGSPEPHFQSVYSRHTPKQSVHDFSREFNWSIGPAQIPVLLELQILCIQAPWKSLGMGKLPSL